MRDTIDLCKIITFLDPLSRCFPCGVGLTSKGMKYSSNNSPVPLGVSGETPKETVLNCAFHVEVDILEKSWWI